MTVLFFSSLSSVFVCSVFQGTSSHSSCTTWQSLQNIWTSVCRQAMEWESFLFAVRAAGTSEHAAGLDDFESSDRISACVWRSTELEKPANYESSELATQCKTPCATRLSYHGICTILRAIRTIYVIRKGPIGCCCCCCCCCQTFRATGLCSASVEVTYWRRFSCPRRLTRTTVASGSKGGGGGACRGILYCVCLSAVYLKKEQVPLQERKTIDVLKTFWASSALLQFWRICLRHHYRAKT